MALGRTKSSPRRQQDADWQEEQVPEADHELDSYLAALAPEEDVETTGSGRRFGSSQVYQLRLPLIANEHLKELAAKHGTSPAALARDWVLQHLSEPEATSTGSNSPSRDQATWEPEAYEVPVEEHAWPEQDFGLETQPAQAPVDPAPLLAPTQHGMALPDREQTEEITLPHGRLR